MSIKAISLVFRALLPNSSSKVVLLRLADFADSDGGSIFPSVPRIARDTQLSSSTVRRCIKLLVRIGVLERLPKPEGKRSNHYFMNFRVLGQLSRTSDEALVQDRREPSSGQAEGVTVTPESSVKHHPTVSVTTRLPAGELQDRLITAAGASIHLARVRRSGLNPVYSWLDDGLCLDRDIVPAIAAKARSLRSGKVVAWSYFDSPVRDWHARRTGSAATAGPATPPPDPSKFTESGWRRRLDHHRSTGRWFDEWGPEPGDLGCLVPPHLLSNGSSA